SPEVFKKIEHTCRTIFGVRRLVFNRTNLKATLEKIGIRRTLGDQRIMKMTDGAQQLQCLAKEIEQVSLLETRPDEQKHPRAVDLGESTPEMHRFMGLSSVFHMPDRNLLH